MLEGHIYSQVFKKDEAKTELSSEKIELSLVEDLFKEFGSLQTLSLDGDILNFANKYEKKIPQLKTLKQKAEDAFGKAKDLGVDELAGDARELSKACDSKMKKIQKKVSLINQLVKI